MAITGGGTGAIANLLAGGGGSSILLEATVPYSKQSSGVYTGAVPEHYCSREQALNLATSSWRRAKEQTPNRKCIGLGATSRLTNGDTERKGRVHEIWVATHSDTETRTAHCVLQRNRSRYVEEDIAVEVIMESLYDAVGLSNSGGFIHRDYDEQIVKMVQNELGYGKVYTKNIPLIVPYHENGMIPPREDMHIVFPGSFNPLHEGHIKMAEAVYKKTKKKILFEFCVRNTDKPMLDYMRLQERVEKLHKKLQGNPMYGGYIVSNDPLFVDKANSGFKEYMIGADTFNRLFDPRHSKRWPEFGFKEKGMHFYVLNRKGIEQSMTYFHELWTFIPEEEYSDPGISSTQLRKASHVH